LPTYDIFDEYRYFEPGKTYEPIAFKGKKIAVTICEDIWNVNHENPLYPSCPMDEVIKYGPDIMINLSASPFSYIQHQERLKVVGANVKLYGIPMVYVNQFGAQTELIFDGGSMVMSQEGKLCALLPFFKESLQIIDTENLKAITKKTSLAVKDVPLKFPHLTETAISLIHDALVLGISDYFSKLGLKQAIIGLSGGIDSAVVLCLAAKALGKENVLSLLLPSGFSSDHSISDAKAIAQNSGTRHEVLPIEENFESLRQTLNPFFKDLPFNVAEENLQARIRAILLMAFSNKFGYILLNTTNKSEAAVGYGTLYGDMCGGLSVIGDVYKTQVYQLAKYINREKEIIPANIISKAPSAELRPNQKDSDSLPEYHILDEILYQYIERFRGPQELVAMGFEKILVDKILKMVNGSEWKRFQSAPVLRVSPKAFGMGRRMPIEGRYLS
jgi:NAD+ synthase (glutamine-hydrolysing)